MVFIDQKNNQILLVISIEKTVLGLNSGGFVNSKRPTQIKENIPERIFFENKSARKNHPAKVRTMRSSKVGKKSVGVLKLTQQNY